ncbi:hypothetical protein TNCV_2986141 [Trichonephila clavipes]|nr:hypothetical protein TNCV_2986141 [Trichonephila clavipes]
MSESGEAHQITSLDEDHDRNLSSPLFINLFTSRLFQLASLLRSVLFLVLLPYRCRLATAAFHNRHNYDRKFFFLKF